MSGLSIPQHACNNRTDTSPDRIAKLEFLDETEELDLVLDHYAISWGLHLASLHDENVVGLWGDWGLQHKSGEVS